MRSPFSSSSDQPSVLPLAAFSYLKPQDQLEFIREMKPLFGERTPDLNADFSRRSSGKYTPYT